MRRYDYRFENVEQITGSLATLSYFCSLIPGSLHALIQRDIL